MSLIMVTGKTRIEYADAGMSKEAIQADVRL